MKHFHRLEQGQAPKQEDLVLVSPTNGLFAVFDGLSITEGGQRAAQIVSQCLSSWMEGELKKGSGQKYSKEERAGLKDRLGLAIQAASKNIFAEAALNPLMHGMCTTVDAIVFCGSHAIVAHVGSGRSYLLRKGELHQVTEDHTQFAYMRRVNKLASLSKAEQVSASKKLTRAVGYREEVKVDLLELELEVGDRFILVTDGIWHSLGDRFEELVGKDADVCAAVEKASSEVKSAKDNSAVLLLEPEVTLGEAVVAGAEQKLQMLGKVPAFEFLSYQELLKVLSTGDLVKFASGQPICREGDPGGEMMLLLNGSADVSKNGQRIRNLVKGDVLGEMSMIDAAPRSAWVVATSATNVLAFRRDDLFQLFRENPSLAVKFLWGIASQLNLRLRSASNQLVGKPDAPISSDKKNQGPLPFLRSV